MKNRRFFTVGFLFFEVVKKNAKNGLKSHFLSKNATKTGKIRPVSADL